jgi:hypothetical protein
MSDELKKQPDRNGDGVVREGLASRPPIVVMGRKTISAGETPALPGINE